MSDSAESTLNKWAEAAFREAADEIIRRAKQTGTPIIIWQDGRVRAVPPEELSEGGSYPPDNNPEET